MTNTKGVILNLSLCDFLLSGGVVELVLWGPIKTQLDARVLPQAHNDVPQLFRHAAFLNGVCKMHEFPGIVLQGRYSEHLLVCHQRKYIYTNHIEVSLSCYLLIVVAIGHVECGHGLHNGHHGLQGVAVDDDNELHAFFKWVTILVDNSDGEKYSVSLWFIIEWKGNKTQLWCKSNILLHLFDDSAFAWFSSTYKKVEKH